MAIADNEKKRAGPASESVEAKAPGNSGSSGKITINDIARLAQVSKKTVSRVINNSPLVRDAKRDRVKLVIAKTGYSPDPQARALAFRKSFLIGLIYDNPSPQYVVNMQHGILEGLKDTGFLLALRPCDRGDPEMQEKVERFIIKQKPFGVILTPSVSEDDALAARLSELDCAYVRIASVEFDAPSQNIRTLDSEGAKQAALELAALGHKRIAHIHGPKTFRSAHERLAGFRAGLKEHGLKLDRSMTIEGAYTFESGLACAKKLLERGSMPTAIFAGNDEMAVGAYQAVRMAGLSVPDDISIVGFDDTPMASRVWPPMTTIRLPITEMGKAAAQLLVNAALRNSGERTVFSPEIIVRESTAPPKE